MKFSKYSLISQNKPPQRKSQSTLLISSCLLESYPWLKNLKGRTLSLYLKKLLNDSELNKKISLLKPRKWKKHYQPDGLDLIPVYFFPDEEDWAKLSILSNGTGFSRCFIFIFLLLFELKLLKLKKNVTKKSNSNNDRVLCRVSLDPVAKRLIRGYYTAPPLKKTGQKQR